MHSALEGLDEEAFLVGPDAPDGFAVDIDPVFAKPWTQVLREIEETDPHALVVDEDEASTPSDVVSGYWYQPVMTGLLLMSPAGKPVGGYLSCDVSVEPEHQGQGLGAELIVEFYLRQGMIPTWFLDTPAYSPAGMAAHRAAWRMLAEQPELIDRKLERLRDRATAPSPGWR
jgi:GNAT superfamily N-acetyltransferase